MAGFVACLAALLFLQEAALGQSRSAAPAFTSAEISASRPNSLPEMRGRFFDGRYELRNATLTDLIRTAWSVDAESVVGGPDWLDVNRFDVMATAPAASSQEILKRMLRELLKERFQLSTHNGSRDLPAWAITAARKPQLQKADGTEASGCTLERAVPYSRSAPVRFVCRNITMAGFVNALGKAREASGYLFSYPVLDRTGIEGAWNFSLKWSPRNIYFRTGAAAETIPLSDAFETQLGLKLGMVKAPTPVLAVEHAVAPRVTESPAEAPQFEVADIKPNDPKNSPPGCSSVRVQPGGRVRIDMTLKGLVAESFGDISPDRIEGGAKLTNPTCWRIEAKAPVEEGGAAGWNGPVWNGLDIDSMRKMLGAVLAERFKLAAHTENRPVDGYVIMAGRTKLRKADPLNRAGCREGPGADGKDPRILNPVASRMVTCRNMTVGQFAAELNKDSFRSRPLVDNSGIEGRYDFTINFSPAAVFGSVEFPDPSGGEAASIPDSAISILQALKGQLGLKVEATKVTAPVLVVDSVNETPTEN
jgi:uncharacterized protein (TIGR03435 family)